ALDQAQQVAGMAGASQAAGLAGASALSQAGAQQQSEEQAKLNAALQAWQDAQNYPLQQLAINQSALTSTPYGGTSTSTQPVNKANPAMGALSGAAAGAAAGSVVPGWGTAIGAGVGALTGYLSSR
ncbi:MAG TPA: glycine zipper domain-containing protein, partial [Stellaceae bacterium]|nr:glycine zipper domain-containing protein [Stellaceae bacterium]